MHSEMRISQCSFIVFKQKTAYEMRISDWSSDVCSSDLSTLIGRLLYDSKMIFEDQLAALEADSRRHGTQGQEIDFALLVDGLAAEREQGITIDVAYRFFATDKRKFIVADTPGHEHYTRNMVTGASTADIAVILVDARKGVLAKTRRHSHHVNMNGTPRSDERGGGKESVSTSDYRG